MSDQLTKIKDLFQHPSEEFTPFPFWFWNDTLSEEEITRQMEAFLEKGIHGFVIHPRLGLPEEIGYLTETYFYYVKYAVKEAARLGMKVVLYDEAMYPSGSCHGQVVRDHPAFASKGLQMISKEAFQVVESMGTIRGVHFGEDDGEPGAPRSVDLLNSDAVASFIAHTHEVYYEYLKDYFGNTIIAMFTDEPNILGRCHIEPMIPWTDGFMEEYQIQGGRKEELYLLFTEAQSTEEEQLQQHAKDCYQKAIYRRLSQAYYKQIGDWCRAHGIALTGHPEKSTDIGYLQYFDIPSQDIVWRFVAPEEHKNVTGEHSTMGKCSSDSARHRGKRRNGNECFGCCGAVDDPYRFTLEDMKWYLDWLFARGVNMIYPHAFYYSMRGKRSEERPPEVGMHSVFWNQYHQVTDYIKRMCGLLTDAVNQTSIAILCQPEDLSWELARPLWENQMEFNYLEEELLEQCEVTEQGLQIADQQYTVLIVEEGKKAESEAVLQQFVEKGGTVIYCKKEAADEKLLPEIRKVLEPFMKTQTPEPDLRMTHLVKDGVSYAILTNEGEHDIDTNLHFSGEAVCEVWDAWNGRIKKLEQPQTDFSLKLSRRESIILHFVRCI